MLQRVIFRIFSNETGLAITTLICEFSKQQETTNSSEEAQLLVHKLQVQKKSLLKMNVLFSLCCQCRQCVTYTLTCLIGKCLKKLNSNLKGLKLEPGAYSTCINTLDKVPTPILSIQEL